MYVEYCNEQHFSVLSVNNVASHAIAIIHTTQDLGIEAKKIFIKDIIYMIMPDTTTTS